jgi:hypothetical protein
LPEEQAQPGETAPGLLGLLSGSRGGNGVLILSQRDHNQTSQDNAGRWFMESKSSQPSRALVLAVAEQDGPVFFRGMVFAIGGSLIPWALLLWHFM